MRPEHVVVVPSALALLPEYTGLEDPLPELRAAAHRAVVWLVERHPGAVAVLTGDLRPEDLDRGVTEPPGGRVARHLLDVAGFDGAVVDEAAGVLVVANGTACRGEKAPGHLDERALGYDREIDDALRSGSPKVLRDLDTALGAELWAHDVPALARMGERVAGPVTAEVDLADDPYGVQYWVVRWTCDS